MSQVASLPLNAYFPPNLKDWIGQKKEQFRFIAEASLLNDVHYKHGEIFRCEEHEEDVMVDTVRVKDGNRFIKLVSLDKTYEGNPMEYEVSEQMLAKYYTPAGRRQPFLEGAQYAVSVGE